MTRMASEKRYPLLASHQDCRFIKMAGVAIFAMLFLDQP